jgi:hypothetical protein
MPLRTGEIFNVRREKKEKPKRYRAGWKFIDLHFERVTIN